MLRANYEPAALQRAALQPEAAARRARRPHHEPKQPPVELAVLSAKQPPLLAPADAVQS